MKAQQLRSLGEFVLTIPPELREKYRTKKALGKLGQAGKRLMQRQGFERGLRRFHWFGDPEEGRAPIYHPHLNLCVEAGYLEPEQLNAVKRSWARILGCAVERVNAYYRYCEEPARIVHRVKYITRATFRDWRWDEEFAREVIGFRNTQTWGKWDGEPVWTLAGDAEAGEGCEEVRKIESLEKSVCPCCSGKVTWGGLVRIGRVTDGLVWDALGAGYYQERESPPLSREVTEDEEAAWVHALEDVLGPMT